MKNHEIHENSLRIKITFFQTRAVKGGFQSDWKPAKFATTTIDTTLRPSTPLSTVMVHQPQQRCETISPRGQQQFVKTPQSPKLNQVLVTTPVDTTPTSASPLLSPLLNMANLSISNGDQDLVWIPHGGGQQPQTNTVFKFIPYPNNLDQSATSSNPVNYNNNCNSYLNLTSSTTTKKKKKRLTPLTAAVLSNPVAVVNAASASPTIFVDDSKSFKVDVNVKKPKKKKASQSTSSATQVVNNSYSATSNISQDSSSPGPVLADYESSPSSSTASSTPSSPNSNLPYVFGQNFGENPNIPNSIQGIEKPTKRHTVRTKITIQELLNDH